jgi:hypothetical protein
MGKQTTPIITTGSQWNGEGWRNLVRRVSNFLGIGPTLDEQGLREMYDSWVAMRKPTDKSPDSFMKWLRADFPKERFGKAFRFKPEDEEAFRTSFSVGNDITSAMGGIKK